MTLPLTAIAKTPNDEFYEELWYLEEIFAPEAWDITTGNRTTVVAVIDSGVDIDHPDLEDQIWVNADETADDGIDNDRNGFVDDVHGWDFVSDDNDPHPHKDNGISESAINHGTLVSGVISAMTDNQIGVAGINWRARLMPIRILDGIGAGTTDDAADAVDYAVENGATIINMSFTGFILDTELERAIRDAYRAGVLVVAAVGNNFDGGLDLNETKIYPACLGTEDEDWVLGVAAIDRDGDKADFSNYGSDCVDVSAPGVDLFGTLEHRSGDPTFGEPYGGYYSGTSVAAPMVTGVATLMQGAFPNLTPEQIEVAIKLSVDPLNLRGTPYEGQMGAGKLNAVAALRLAQEFSGGVASAAGDFEVFNGSRVIVGRERGATDVIAYDGAGVATASWLGYGPGFLGGVRLAMGDVNGDGHADVITGAGVGGGPQVRMFTEDGALLGQFFAFDTALRTGVQVAAGNVDGDRAEEIIASMNGTVRIFETDGSMLREFPSGGKRIAAGDIDDDGTTEILVASGPGVAPSVRVLDVLGNLVSEFHPYAPGMTSGLFVEAGDFNGDGKDEVVTGTDVGAGPQVQIWENRDTWTLTGQFFAFDETFRGGVRVAVGDANGDGLAELVTAPGPGNINLIRVFDSHGALKLSFSAFAEGFEHGLNVAVW